MQYIARETYVNVLKDCIEAHKTVLTIVHRVAYNSVLENVWGENCGIHVLDAPRGSRKTLLLYLIRAEIQKSVRLLWRHQELQQHFQKEDALRIWL